MFTANIYTPLDMGMVLQFYYNFAAGSCQIKKRCGRFYSIGLKLYSQQPQIRFFQQLFEGDRSNVRTSSIARWKARGRLPISD